MQDRRAFGSWELVGRAEELELLVASMGPEGRNGVVLAGAAGVGKTRLATELEAIAVAAGRTVRRAVATRSASRVAFGALAPLLPSDVTADHGLRPIADALGHGNAVLAVDDAHLLDDVSAAVIHQLASSGGAFVIATIRSGEPAPDAITALWKDEHAVRVDVQPLAEEEVSELLRSVLGGPVDGVTQRRLWEITEGNPLYLRELVLSGLEASTLIDRDGVWTWRGGIRGGQRVTELITARLGAITDEGERTVLDTLAMVEPIGLRILEDVCVSGDIGACEQRGLVKLEADDQRINVRLAHPLYGDVISQGLGEMRRRALLASVADAVESYGMHRSDDVMRVAAWRLDAGQTPDPDVLTRAAIKAVEFADHALTERLARAALSSGATEAEGLDALIALANALFYRGRYDEALTIAETIDLSEADEPQLLKGGMMRATTLFWGVGRQDEAMVIAQDAVDRLTDPELKADFTAYLSSLIGFSGDPERSVEMAESILADGAITGTARIRSWTTTVIGKGMLGRCLDALADADTAFPQVLGSQEIPLAIGELMMGQTLARWIAGHLDDLDATTKGLYDFASSEGPSEFGGPAALIRGRAMLFRGRVDEAILLLREASALLSEQDLGGLCTWGFGSYAGALALSGDADGARAAIDVAVGRLIGRSMFESEVRMHESAVLALEGRMDQARETARMAADIAMGPGLQMMALHGAVRLGAGPDYAARLAALAPHVQGDLAPVFSAYGAAVLAGDGAALDIAAAALAAIGLPLFAAEAWGQAAAAHHAAGLVGSRMASLEKGRAAAALVPGCRTPLLGLLEGDTALALLTAREREIAQLAASGLTKREIAERLVLSVRTVGNHLYNLYAKLGVSSREELAAALGERLES